MSADLAYAGLARQAELIRAGETSSRELTELHLRRIERLDPTLNAFRVVLAEKALAEAQQADARRKAGDERPLLGVPIAVKDDMDVAGEVTARGSRAHGGPAAADAEVVRRLRAAGAVIVGKTHVPELEIVPFTETPTFGITRNPWDLERTPGGSSGGSAAAVAAALVPAAVASDGAGSIRIPAGCCGLVGLKPQRGRVPTAPKLEAWNGLSTWGVVARRVEDVALFHSVVDEPGSAPLDLTPPAKLRIAVSRAAPPGLLAKADAEMLGAVDRAVELLRGLGHEVTERELDYGMSVGPNILARYFRGVHDDAIAMAHPERLSRRTKGYARLGKAVGARGLARARAAEAADRARLEAIFDHADVVLTPQLAHRPLPIMACDGRGALRTHLTAARFVPFNGAFNHTGQPAISLPIAHAADGFPLPVQLVGPTDGDPLLVALAAQLQAEVGWPELRPPAFA
jgi:amidase